MKTYAAIYDFELMPYALGDVLTWNVQTAIRCEDAGCDRVDIHICIDQQRPASIYQSETVTADNCWIFFNELFGAFGTHPRLGNIIISRSREEALARMRTAVAENPANQEAVDDYERALANRNNEDALVAYFVKYIYYHKGINAFAAKHGRIPLLQQSLGCGPDVKGLLSRHLADKRIVVVHMRMRRLDAGYGGIHTRTRDSDFVEWYDFLRAANKKYPDVQFVVVGRLQEKPLEFLRLPNVTSIRTLGMGLGHELTLMLRSDLFIGTSSGFAALANFSTLPYFITKMGVESCNAYEIEYGADRLPFGTDRQRLIYEPETSSMLMRLLEEGLAELPPREGARTPKVDPAIDVRSWEWERNQWMSPGATISRFHLEPPYRDKETAFLIWPKLQIARSLWRRGSKSSKGESWSMLIQMENNFPQVCARFPEFLRLRCLAAIEHRELETLRACKDSLKELAAKNKAHHHALRYIRRCEFFGMVLLLRCRFIWKNRRYIPGKLRQIVRRAHLGFLARI
jgi:hypothetical protein